MAERSSVAMRATPAAWLLLLLFSFTQRWGEITFDTKFDLSVDPGSFMLRSLHLWNPQSSFGELQNQAYGYLFPQGLFALVGEKLGITEWVVQRLWMALLLIVAFEGCRRLWRALAPDSTPWAGLVSGLAYATAPRLLGLSGVLSAEVLPTAVLPWVVLPVVLAQRGRLGVRAGALLSGVAVLFMGGVNAVEDLATFPLPFLVVMSTIRSPLGRRLALWWTCAMAAAVAWWMLPLLVLGRYSPPFLDYIETSEAVVRPLGWTNVTRGADHWLSFIHVGYEPWWPGSYDLATAPYLVALTAVVAGVSLVGLCHVRMPLRRPLLISLLLGLVCLTIARPGPLSSPLNDLTRALMDGPLAVLRNVHKVDPLVRLPLALGIGHVIATLAVRRPRRRRRDWVRPIAAGLVVLFVLGAAEPLYAGTLRKSGWKKIPSQWTQVASYLGDHADGRAALILPGSGFGQQLWGWTIDEPMQGVAHSPWVTRSQVPLTPGSTIRFLDSIEERDDDGLGSPKLATALARAGIGYVLVRRDLDISASGAPTSARVDKSIGRSPGFEHVRSFGEPGPTGQPPIDLYRVERQVPRVEASPLQNARTMVGGPADVLTALEAGAVQPDEPVLIQPTDAFKEGISPDVVGDGYRRRERQFGRVHDAVSQMMTDSDHYRIRRAANDYPGTPGVRRVYAKYEGGLQTVTASTSGGYVDTLGSSQPEHGPYAAVDGLHNTYWQSTPFVDPTKQWVELRLSEPTPVSRLRIDVGVDGLSGAPVRGIRVTAGDVSHTYRVDPTSGVVQATFAGAPVRTIRVAVTRAAAGDDPVAIREIHIPGINFGRTLVVPDAGADAHTAFVMRARPHRRACVETPLGPDCALGQGRTSEEEGGIFRQITVDQTGSWRLTGSVVALPTRSSESLLAPLFGQVRVVANSVYQNEPGVAGQLAYDGDIGTSWLADPSQESPALKLSWRKPATLTRLQIVAAGGNTVPPTGAVITAGKQRRVVELGQGSLGFFKPLTTRKARITFTRPETVDAGSQILGIAELRMSGLGSQRYDLRRNDPTGAICGLGPEIVVDGQVYRTKVSGTVGDVLDGGPLKVKGCSGPLRLSPGKHVIKFTSTEQFQPTALTLTPSAASHWTPAPDRGVGIESWTSHDRKVRLDAGPASILRIPENVNAGWEAHLGDKLLKPITVDGWQQGFLVPAGEGGTVALKFTPDRNYRLGLLIGGVLALGIIALAMVMWRWEPRSSSFARSAKPVRARWWGIGLLIGSGYILGGPGIALGIVLGFLSSRYFLSPSRLAGALVAGAGLIAGALAVRQRGLPPGWVDLVAACGVGMVVAAYFTATTTHGYRRQPDD